MIGRCDRWIVTILVLLGIICTTEASARSSRVALVIGNGEYQAVPPLVNPVNDANDIAMLLESLDFEVIQGTNLSMSDLKTLLRRFYAKLEGAEIAAFYYAGHGLQVDGANLIVPIDAALMSYDDVEFELVPLQSILSAMERKVATNLVFLDACRDNPLARDLARSMGTRSAAVGRGLAQIGGGLGTLIAFATQPGNIAYDGKGANSPFTSGLLRHVGAPGEDIAISLRRVRNEVLAETAGRQVPWENSSLTGDVILKPALPIPDAASGAEASRLTDAAVALDQAQSFGTAAAYRVVVESFPDTPQALLAKAAIDQIETALPPAVEEVPAPSTEPGKLTPSNPSSASPPVLTASRDSDADAAIDEARLIGTMAAYRSVAERFPGTPQARVAEAVIVHLEVLERLPPLTEPTNPAQPSEDLVVASIDPARLVPGGSEEEEAALRLTESQRRAVQLVLLASGYDTRGVDGAFGRATRSAIRSFQFQTGRQPTGYLNRATYDGLAAGEERARRLTGEGAVVYARYELLPGTESRLAKAVSALSGRQIKFALRAGALYIAVVGWVGFDEARMAAKAAGGDLLAINSAAEDQFIYSMISSEPLFWDFSVDRQSRLGYWVSGPGFGLRQNGAARSSHSGWAWSDGSPVTYTHWDPVSEQPNEIKLSGKAGYGAYGGHTSRDRTVPYWQDAIFGKQKVPGFIIEIPGD